MVRNKNEKKSKYEFWIDASLADKETEEKIMMALGAVQQVHNWTVSYLNAYFLEHRDVPSFQSIRSESNLWMKKQKLWKQSQRYTLEKACEQTFPYFSANLRLDEEKRVVPVVPENISTLQIKTRRVWKRYLAQGSGITTIYGMIFPEGDWKTTLRRQAGDIPLDLFPYLWHSVVIKLAEREKFFMHFNFHLPNSISGQIAQEQLEMDYADSE